MAKVLYFLTEKCHTTSPFFRSDYENFVRDLSKQVAQNLPSRVDTYMASIIQVLIYCRLYIK